jgi:hypothetical protein
VHAMRGNDFLKRRMCITVDLNCMYVLCGQPEFLNRLDEFIIFKTLQRSTIRTIVEKQVRPGARAFECSRRLQQLQSLSNTQKEICSIMCKTLHVCTFTRI